MSSLRETSAGKKALPSRSRCRTVWLPLASVVLSGLFGSSVAQAATGAWTAVGPLARGGQVNALAVDPVSVQIVYAGTDAGVFKSSDGGATWQRASVGLAALRIRTLAIDPSPPATLYAGAPGQIFKSTNGADTWSEVLALDSFDVTGLAVDRVTRAVFATMVFTGPTIPELPPSGSLKRSTDGGQSWIDLAFPSIPHRIAVDQRTPSTLYVSGPYGIWKSVDGGQSWQNVSGGLPRYSFLLAIDSLSPSTLYCGGSGLGVFKSSDGGQSWLPLTAFPAPSLLIWTAVAAAGSVYVGTSGGVFRSGDGGSTWAAASNGLGGSVSALVLDPVVSTTLFAGGNAGAFKSVNAASSWSDLAVSFAPRPVAAVAAVPGSPGLLFAGTPSGMFRSVDLAATWTTAGLATWDVRAVAVPAQAPTGCVTPCPGLAVVYAGVLNDGIFKTSDGGATWARVSGGVVSSITSLVIDRTNPSVIYGRMAGGALFKTTDGAASWTPLFAGMTDYRVRALVMDPFSTSTLYAATPSEIYRSSDGGAHWAALPSGAGAGSLAAAPGSETVLYAGKPFPPSGVMKSLDSGAHWFDARNGLPTSSDGVTAVDADPSSSQIAFAGTYHSGVFVTLDGGASWGPANEGLPTVSFPYFDTVDSFARDPAFPSKLYALTSSGLYGRTVDVPTANCAAGSTTIDLTNSRFQMSVAWRALSGQSGCGQAVPVTSGTGAFWFFDPTNLEVVVKVLDGRSINGKFWVFYGSLTNVEFTVTVTDTQTGAVKTYFNPQGQLASVVDTTAF